MFGQIHGPCRAWTMVGGPHVSEYAPAGRQAWFFPIWLLSWRMVASRPHSYSSSFSERRLGVALVIDGDLLDVGVADAVTCAGTYPRVGVVVVQSPAADRDAVESALSHVQGPSAPVAVMDGSAGGHGDPMAHRDAREHTGGIGRPSPARRQPASACRATGGVHHQQPLAGARRRKPGV